MPVKSEKIGPTFNRVVFQGRTYRGEDIAENVGQDLLEYLNFFMWSNRPEGSAPPVIFFRREAESLVTNLFRCDIFRIALSQRSTR